MKVIFLDHDGVICLYHNWGSRNRRERKSWLGDSPKTKLEELNEVFDDFDNKSIDVLNQILEATDAEIVISSDWKNYASLEDLKFLYENRGIIKTPIAVTPNLKDFDSLTYSSLYYKRFFMDIRSIEINKWIEENNPQQWVAVDDLDLRRGVQNFVQTPLSFEGIKQSGVAQKIIRLLNENQV